MESEGSLPYSQEPATCPEPYQSSPCPPIPLLEDPFQYIHTNKQTHFLDPSSNQCGMNIKLVTKERKRKENDIGCDYNLVMIESMQLKQFFNTKCRQLPKNKN
jgi:hypothetical protein